MVANGGRDAIDQRFGFPTKLGDRGLFLDQAFARSLEQVWTPLLTRPTHIP